MFRQISSPTFFAILVSEAIIPIKDQRNMFLRSLLIRNFVLIAAYRILYFRQIIVSRIKTKTRFQMNMFQNPIGWHTRSPSVRGTNQNSRNSVCVRGSVVRMWVSSNQELATGFSSLKIDLCCHFWLT